MIFQLNQVCRDLNIEKKNFFPGSSESFFEYKITGGDFWGCQKEGTEEFLYFKNIAKVMNYPMMKQTLPSLSKMYWKDIDTTPYFVSGLESIREAVANGRKIGIEGGPCLFGAWEVFIELILKDGTVKVYDFNIGCLVENGKYVKSEPLLMEAMQIYADQIQEIHFKDEKDGLTGQEIASVQYLFEAAAALDAQVILSIPDFSYVKFLKAILAYLETDGMQTNSGSMEESECAKESNIATDYGEPDPDVTNSGSTKESESAKASEHEKGANAAMESGRAKETNSASDRSEPDPNLVSGSSDPNSAANRQAEVRRIQENCLAEFRTVTYRIADLYLELVEYLRGRYPGVKCEPVHERREDLCAIYYEKREPYIERRKILRSIQNSAERYESLKDYISLSALPYYLFGITDILHICNLDEIDSYQKCRKAHKGAVHLACLLFPEYLSTDGCYIEFYAEKKYKEYFKNIEEYFEHEDRSLPEGRSSHENGSRHEGHSHHEGRSICEEQSLPEGQSIPEGQSTHGDWNIYEGRSSHESGSLREKRSTFGHPGGILMRNEKKSESGREHLL